MSGGQPPYVVVSGNIATGKTTASAWLAEELGVVASIERPDRNPFLERFYRDRPRWAFTSQMWFLTDSAARNAAIRDSGGGGAQDRFLPETQEVFSIELHAEGSLSDEEFAVLQTAYEQLRRNLAWPDLVVLLEAKPSELRTRVAARARWGEDDEVDEDYLARLRDRYEALFAGWSRTALLRIDTEAVDLRREPERRRVAAEVREALRAVSP